MPTSAQPAPSAPSPKPKRAAKAKPILQDEFNDLFGLQQGEQDAGGFKLIEHGLIATAPQPRRSFPDSEIAELAQSIQALRDQGAGLEGTGLLQPLIVRPLKTPTPEGARYLLVAGERRFRATQRIELPRVPALVVPMDERGVLLAQLVENLQRQGLPPLEEARSLRKLMDEQGLSIRDAVQVLGKSRGYLTNRLDLLKMGEDVQAMVSSREDTLKHAAIIQGVQDAELRAVLIRAVGEEDLSVKDLERRLRPAEEQVSPREDTSQADAADEAPSRDRAPRPTPPRDPVGDMLKPAARLAQEAARVLADASLTPDYKKQVRAQIHALDSSLADLKQLLR